MNFATASTLVALIALLIGAICKFNIGLNWSQIELPLGKNRRLILFTRTWLAGVGAIAAAALFLCAATWHPDARHLAGALLSSGLLFGAVTQNFLWPATGATSPTAAAYNLSGGPADTAIVDLVTDGVATTFTVTHNMGISTADITAGFPHITFEPNSPTGIPATLLILITRPIASGNAVVLTFAAVAATFRMVIKRPNSIGR
jgi:hypothetical protein